MQQSCTRCASAYDVTDEDLLFYDRVSPVFGGKKFAVPPPDHCPDCRQQRRLAWRNERTLYSRECGLCQRKIVSVYASSSPFPVYCITCWWSDKWDPKSYGVDYDPARPFLDQWKELRDRVPQLAIMNDEGLESENSEYCYDISRAKNCYRVIGSWYIQDCLYSLNVNRVRNIVDCNTVSLDCELVYESIDCQRLYHCAYLKDSENCSDCFFGYDLRGCKDCFCCFGLRQKQFCIWNEQLTEEEYRKRFDQQMLGSHQFVQETRKQFDQWILPFPRRYANLLNCEDCVGNNLFNCKSVLGYSAYNSEYSKFIDRSDGPKNCYDLIQTGGGEWCCDCVTPDNSYMTLFSTWCWKGKYILLSDNCHTSEHLLGCISMKRSKYCILNKEYSPEEYEQLAGQILQSLIDSREWNGLLPIRLSPFGYNESAALEYYPLTKEETLARGWYWRDELPYTTGKETVQMDTVPDSIAEVQDPILDHVLACEVCGKNFKLMSAELAFYRQMPVPLPRSCFDCRHLNRFHRKNPTHLWDRTCAKCDKAIQTTFNPDRPEIVYCERCYLETVY